MSYFKSKDSLGKIISKLYKDYQKAKKENDIHSNAIDPFSALLEASFNNMTLSDWIVSEEARQVQKTLQNAIGTFHEEIIGEIIGFEHLQVGKVIDIVSSDRKIVAEIKNKYNTTKGNHKIAIYRDIATVLSLETYSNYTGYYVEIIPKKPIAYNKPFEPSDNTTHERMPQNEKIRVIDGKSFYAMITGDENAIYSIYDEITKELLGLGLTVNDEFKDLLHKAYGKQ